MMKHRTYSGKIVYTGDTVGERGREWFTVTVHGNGDRTMRSVCEMDDSEVLRDVVYSVDKTWRPLDAFVRLTVKDAFMGSGWFRFTDGLVECESFTAEAGRTSQRVEVEVRPRTFGPHPVACDIWHLAAFDLSSPKKIQTWPNAMSSPLSNGASGPMIGLGAIRVEHIGPEEVTVPAGTFQCERFRFLLKDRPPEELWCTVDDYIMVKIRWDLLETTYELVELTR